MKLKLFSYGLCIIPENAADLKYIKALGVEKCGDTISLRLITVSLDECYSWEESADIGRTDCVELVTEGVVNDLKNHTEANGVENNNE